MAARKMNGENYEVDDEEYMPPSKRRKGMTSEGEDLSFSEDEDDIYDEQDIENTYNIETTPVIEQREEEPPPPPVAASSSSSSAPRKNKRRAKEKEKSDDKDKDDKEKEEKQNKNRYHCNYCRKDITEVVRIKCSVCTDFDLCVECFSVGVEITPHKNNHEYQVMDNMHFPLFDEAWGADEEILLLEAIEMYGLGNWNDVSDHVGTKNWLDCKTQYFDTYINVPTAPLPDFSKVLTTHAMVQQLNKKSREGKAERAPPATPPKVSLKVTPTPSNNEIHCALVDALGYMRNRNEFETEWENDAEIIIRDTTFDDDDDPVEKDLKLRALEIYNEKLDQRVKLRKFILDNNLLDYKKTQQIERKRTKEDRELYSNMRVFLQVFPTRKDYDDLMNGLATERQLRRRIEQLQKWRASGVKSLTEGDLFEFESQRRENSIRRAKDSAGYYNFDKRDGGRSAGSSRRDRYLAREKEDNALARLDKLIKARPRKPGQPLDLDGVPGVELLSTGEKSLCSTVRIMPKQYMVIKDTLLAEYAKLGHLNKTVARSLVKIDVNKTARIFEFFEKSGWINRPNSAPTSLLDSSTGIPPPSPFSSLASSVGLASSANLIVSTQAQAPVVVAQIYQR